VRLVVPPPIRDSRCYLFISAARRSLQCTRSRRVALMVPLQETARPTPSFYLATANATTFKSKSTTTTAVGKQPHTYGKSYVTDQLNMPPVCGRVSGYHDQLMGVKMLFYPIEYFWNGNGIMPKCSPYGIILMARYRTMRLYSTPVHTVHKQYIEDHRLILPLIDQSTAGLTHIYSHSPIPTRNI
jgi:hypothetical protein